MIDPKKTLVIHALQTPDGDVTVWQRPSDGYINVTQICQASGKFYANWKQQDTSEQYLQAVSERIGIPIGSLVQSVTNGPRNSRGTWAHPRIALRIAQWCSPNFAAQVDEWLEAWIRGDVGLDLNSRSIIRMLLYPTPQPWEKKFPNVFYQELSRLYGLDYNPKKGAPGGMHAANLTDKLIYSRFPEEIRQELRNRNPVTSDDWRRKSKNFQFFKGDLASQLDYTIDLCVRIMKQFSRKESFETAWDLVMPRGENKQMLLIPEVFSPDIG